jgi:hypothetical protein
MAGLKNMYQIYGGTPMTPIEGESIWDRDMKFRSQEYTPFCQFCGRELINSPVDENGHKVDPEWEKYNRAHYKCYREKARR